MAVAYQTHAITTISSTSSIVITKPASLAVGDLMVAQIFSTSTPNSLPSGFTQLLTTVNTNRSTICYKVADSGDVAASDFTFGLPGTELSGGALIRISGATSVAPIPESAGATATNTATPSFANTITPHVADSLLLFFTTTTATSITGISGYSVTTSDPTWTELYDSIASSVRGFSAAYASRPQVTATGNSTCTGANIFTTSTWTGQIIAVMPPLESNPTETVTCTDAVQQTIMSTYSDTVTPTDTITAEKQKTWATQNKSSTTWANIDKS